MLANICELISFKERRNKLHHLDLEGMELGSFVLLLADGILKSKWLHVIHLGLNKIPEHAKLLLCSKLGVNVQNHKLQV